MIQEEKSLLLQDLCARLPYGVIVKDRNGIHKLTVGNTEFTDLFGGKCNIKPYLRPMSSMTEEEKETYHNLCYEEEREELEFGEWAARVYYHDTIESIDYLNSIHIDYRELIPKGLAIEVTEENNPYKE